MGTTENTDPGRIRTGTDRVFGVQLSMPTDDPFRLVLGEQWVSYRWYASAAERDEAMALMQAEHRYSRIGDTPSIIYAKVEREKPPAPLKRPAA